MRLLQVNIFKFRSIADQQLTAEGLVVLFGPNSAGKTTVLEAAEQLITRAEIRRVDPADLEEVYVDGSVFFDLPEADVPSSLDAETYRCCCAVSAAMSLRGTGLGTEPASASGTLAVSATIMLPIFAA